jgi:hypothetical protein
MTTSTPAGWYPDPSGQLRFWDGAAWTAQTAPPPSLVAVAPPPVQVQVVPTRRSVGQQLRRGLIAGGVVMVLIIGVSVATNMKRESAYSQDVNDAYCQSFGADNPDC